MKTLLLALTIGLGLANAQSAPARNTYTGSLAPTGQQVCTDSANVGSVYYQLGSTTVIWDCVQSGTGLGAYAWTARQLQPAGTGTTGTLAVAAGKAAAISNSLTFAGTDSTTQTFPTTSATIARTDAANTFTGVQTFSSAPVFSTGTITNTGTVTLPTSTGGVPVLYSCGATSGAATCANTSGGATARVITGLATLASNSAVISGISPAFTGTTTFSCASNDQTTIGNPTKVLNTSSSSITISDTTGASDVVAYVCVGY